MTELRQKIQNECNNKKVPQHVIEKDYALSYILAGIAQQPELSNSLIFKGGTALKKIYFGDYRFSEDLDFSVQGAPKGQKLMTAILNAINISKELLFNYGPFEIQLKQKPESAPHPHGQEAFIISIKFPWHRQTLCRVKIEITHDEIVVLPPNKKCILHGYEEELDSELTCYPIEEIIAEKMRTLLQTQQKLTTSGRNRPRARDYYDLWHILKKYRSTLDKNLVIDALNQKCNHRNVSYQNVEDFFTSELTSNAQEHWIATLGVLVQNLPDCNLLLSETKILISDLLS